MVTVAVVVTVWLEWVMRGDNSGSGIVFKREKRVNRILKAVVMTRGTLMPVMMVKMPVLLMVMPAILYFFSFLSVVMIVKPVLITTRISLGDDVHCHAGGDEGSKACGDDGEREEGHGGGDSSSDDGGDDSDDSSGK